MPTLTIFGIKSCDTMKKAFQWLDGKKVAYTFHDYKKGNLTKEDIEVWMKDLPIEEIINKKGTTWKKSTDEEKASISDSNKAIELILKNPSIVKRPLVQMGKKHLVGFNPEQWDIFFS
ncbi:Spx/MgsR family RNA polymerase-binding regulatory protein [uncultured Cytophaga sp.]|uniref:Spx/MgsR family RNA polymerase-binding regulatory protein n=1 Tax=uncultured Cytophaga sp. TaxID=160238 RepID=UPI00262C62FE|nr:Spx/MgsR family RNA polymerase-binding regulatory protein [uncultured Cytophaga sp.]